MAEDKLLKDKKTKENIYALDLEFEDEKEVQEIELEEAKIEGSADDVFFKGYNDFDEDEEEPKKKKMSKIEEGIKSSKRGRPRKDGSVAKATTKKATVKKTTKK